MVRFPISKDPAITLGLVFFPVMELFHYLKPESNTKTTTTTSYRTVVPLSYTKFIVPSPVCPGNLRSLSNSDSQSLPYYHTNEK